MTNYRQIHSRDEEKNWETAPAKFVYNFVQCKRPTLVADLTNLPFEYLMQFSHKIVVHLCHDANVKDGKKVKSRGSCLIN